MLFHYSKQARKKQAKRKKFEGFTSCAAISCLITIPFLISPFHGIIFFTYLPKTVEILQNLCYNDNVITKQTYEVNL